MPELATKETMDYNPSMLARYLPEYYRRLFPFKPFCRWLSYGEKASSYFARREFAFILEGDVHLRYRSFSDAVEFEKELCKTSPHKLDIGAVYSHQPKDNKKFGDFRALERELVFDIDLTDYNEIRTCCSEASLCRKCWRWITIAVRVLDNILKEDFGFEHRLWVFSGRRGVHCWVADSVARKLTTMGRAAIAEYLSLISGDKKVVSVASKRGHVHPMVSDAYQLIMESGEFDRMVIEQGWLSDQQGFSSFLEGCTDISVRDELNSIVNDVLNVESTEQRWHALRIKLDEIKRKEMAEAGLELCQAASKEAMNYFRGFVLQRAYPRLDVNVSTSTNHLLKSPFCIHPKTGRVAVPITPGQVAHLSLDTLPRIDRLLSELSKVERDEKQNGNRKTLDYKHTSLAPFVETFEVFVDGILKENFHSD
uniref:DNA primase n=1 Tax=Parascaris univalens TaxID=6257 RepID=A0A915BK18_PARUN